MSGSSQNSAPILKIEYVQSLSVDGKRVTEGVDVFVRLFYEIISSGWMRDAFPNARSRGNDFMTLVFLSLHARPLIGEDLKTLIKLGIATPEDEGRLYARVTDLGLSIEMGIRRETVAVSAERLRDSGLIEIHDLPSDFRDSKGRFAGNKAYLLSGELERKLMPEVTPRDEDLRAGSTRAGSSRTDPSGTEEGENRHRAGSTVPVHPAHRAGSSGTNMLACLHDDDNDDNVPNPPTRQPCGLSVSALKNEYPLQPKGLDPDRAFNLALDRALALLSPKLRQQADVPLHTLAAELHPAAAEQPSRRWSAAGGAGWVLDAVEDAVANGTIGSVNLIRTIVSRWLAEGNPYAVRLAAEDREDVEEALIPLEASIAATWRVATGRELGRDDVHRLSTLLGPNVPLTRLQDVVLRGAALVPDLTIGTVEALIAGKLALASVDEDVEPPPAPRGSTQETPTDPDPLLAEVIRMYEAEIGIVTEGATHKLLALTEEYRDLDRWRRAFDAVVGSNVRRLDYLEVCLENDGKSKTDKPRAGSGRGQGTRSPKSSSKRPRRSKSQRGRVVSPEEMPDVEPEDPLPLP